VHILSFASHIAYHTLAHPTIEYIRSFHVFILMSQYWHMRSQIEIQVHGIH
jgi:hypothetical protein